MAAPGRTFARRQSVSPRISLPGQLQQEGNSARVWAHHTLASRPEDKRRGDAQCSGGVHMTTDRLPYPQIRAERSCTRNFAGPHNQPGPSPVDLPHASGVDSSTPRHKQTRPTLAGAPKPRHTWRLALLRPCTSKLACRANPKPRHRTRTKVRPHALVGSGARTTLVGGKPDLDMPRPQTAGRAS